MNVCRRAASVRVDCRVPPGLGEDHVRRRLAELIGPEEDGGYRVEFRDDTSATARRSEGPLADAIADFVDAWDPDARCCRT